jgi:precorrin-8X/cobalt-precorrin-8 methylmutase
MENNLHLGTIPASGKNIELQSFNLITEELGDKATKFSETELPVLKRVIHTSADFDYADNLWFSHGAVESGLDALKRGATIVTDTTMALSGISKPALKTLNCKAVCFIADRDVTVQAQRNASTRASAAMNKAAELAAVEPSVPIIFALGNAPTALTRVHELIEAGILSPALVIGVPVGFVNVTESKALFTSANNDNINVPCIITKGRKGGSNVAAAIVNALLYQIVDRV